MRFYAAIALLVFVLLGFVGPYIFTNIIGFSPYEQHYLFPDAPPFSKDVPLHHQHFDNDPACFDTLDINHDGVLIIRNTPLTPMCDELLKVQQEFHDLVNAYYDHQLPPSILSKMQGHDDLEGFIQATRCMRLSQLSLASMDTNGDHRVTRSEFKGAPIAMPFILGTDELGRDLLTRVLAGLRLSVLIVLVSTFIAYVWGTFYGLIAGYLGGLTDIIMMRFVDLLYGLPYILFVSILIAIIGQGVFSLVIAIVIVQWLLVARLTRPITASIKTEPFVLASKGLGASRWWVLTRHILPLVAKQSISILPIIMTNVVRQEVLLSFLGLGINPPYPSLGNIISEGLSNMPSSLWSILWPSIIVFVLLLLTEAGLSSFNTIRQ